MTLAGIEDDAHAPLEVARARRRDAVVHGPARRRQVDDRRRRSRSAWSPRGLPAFLLDGDNLRHGLNGDLGFDEQARRENVRRTAHVARLLAESGTIALVSLVSPYAADREAAAALHAADELDFLEIFVDAPLELCEQRDPKGLYARARAGELTGLTGVGAPYEPPTAPDLVLGADRETVEAEVERVLELLARARPAGERALKRSAPRPISSALFPLLLGLARGAGRGVQRDLATVA